MWLVCQSFTEPSSLSPCRCYDCHRPHPVPAAWHPGIREEAEAEYWTAVWFWVGVRVSRGQHSVLGPRSGSLFILCLGFHACEMERSRHTRLPVSLFWGLDQSTSVPGAVGSDGV